MRRLYAIGFPVLMAFDTLAQTCFKVAGTHALPFAPDAAWILRVAEQPWTWIALCGYLGAFVTWMRLLRDAPIGPAFAASHLEVVSVLLVSAWFLHERITPLQLFGALVIVLGIGLLAISESRETAEHADATPH
ncbi:DMT family transporter [Solilutibacter silvestris]|uniref:EamA-like transporter protein n=1 Tax=Solilutibacter silvestris TaxID=1645665 RepID=A0A2K1Q214_9GAMM|nr:DMT family transporter [Lysobacter silvestris]PNS09085.1 EamA-like transporter protein [Lysobacter silvestris]